MMRVLAIIAISFVAAFMMFVSSFHHLLALGEGGAQAYHRHRRVGRSTTISATGSTRLYVAKKGDDEDVVLLPSSNSGLKTPLINVKGIGPKTYEMLTKLNLYRVSDALLHFPVDAIDRSNVLASISSVPSEGNVVISISLNVYKIKEGFGNSPHQIWCRDSVGESMKILYFFRGGPWNSPWKFLKQTYIEGNRVIVSGKVTRSKSALQELELINPDIVAVVDDDDKTLTSKFGIEPVYPLTAGLTASKLKPIIAQAIELSALDILTNDNKLLKFYGEVENQQSNKSDDNPNSNPNPNKKDPPSQLEYSKRGWPSIIDAIKSIHYPQSNESIAINSRARERLAFDELVYLTYQKLSRERERERDRSKSDIIQDNGSRYELKLQSSSITDQFLKALPFKLTNSQQNSINDIFADLESKEKMSRLVQGDVGSGKTVVAFMAMLRAVESGKQACLLAPTMILASQHYSNLLRLVKGIKHGSREVGVRMISGSVVGKERLQLLRDVSDSSVDIVIGTHALLSEKVIEAFSDKLGLVVIDEEQRFGVDQRALLAGRANALFTTATPIPRSLLLVTQHDKSISTLTEKPPSKRPIKTVLIKSSITDVVIDRLRANIAYGTKVFWVAPALDATKRMPGSSASERFDHLSQLFPGQVALLHGQMTDEQKKDTMEKFSMANSEIKILVATTVIEVGVDVPDASICVIDRAEYFGLSQLHQIRGRIGRGSPPPGERISECFCALIYDDSTSSASTDSGADNVGKEGWRKLQVLVDSTDGFEIAEADLKLRGPGDIFGSKQSGAVTYRAADINAHFHLLLEAQIVANHLLVSTSDIAREALRFLESIYSNSTVDMVLPTTTTKSKNADKKKGASIQLAVEPKRATPILDLVKDNPIIIILDVESTGLSTSEDRITQIAAKVYGDDSNNNFCSYVLPPSPHRVSLFIEGLTGIKQSFLETSGITFQKSWLHFQSWLSSLQEQGPGRRPIVVAAHNGANFDFKIIASELQRAFPTDYQTRYSEAFAGSVDTLALLKNKHIWAGAGLDVPGRHRLEDLYSHLYGVPPEKSHNAIYDCIALEKLLLYPGIDTTWKDFATRIVYRHEV